MTGKNKRGWTKEHEESWQGFLNLHKMSYVEKMIWLEKSKWLFPAMLGPKTKLSGEK
tara:strand:- start:43 stop:213 length:171 start_codon:yes stop_codon:yes gene_type:complete